MNLELIKCELRSAGLDGWLFFDHHGRDPLAHRILGLKADAHVSRRWYYFIPAHGAPRGMGRFIRHRTGHSIGREVHGVGANMDNYETHDVRCVIPQTCFSVEPALYLPDFGVRTEVNVFVEPHGARVTGAVQNEFVTL